MMARITPRPTHQRPPFSSSPTFSPTCAPASNQSHFLQRFIGDIFPASLSHRIIALFNYPKKRSP